MTTEYVYYIRRGGLIKIGWTRHLADRMRALRPDDLLALEPGNRFIEIGRHQQFAALRVHEAEGREWFSPEPELLEHIARIAEMYSTPDLSVLLPPPVWPSAPMPTFDPVPAEQVQALARVRELGDRDLAELSEEELVAALHDTELVRASARVWSGRMAVALKKRHSWSTLVEMTGLPQSTLRNRIHQRPSIRAEESA